VRTAVAILALFAAFGLIGISDPPSGLHRWREADTCTVAWNMATGDGDLLHPRVNARGTGSGTTKQEFPLYNWLTAEGWRIFGWNHAVPRGLGIAFALLGMWSLRSLTLTLGGGPRVANLAMLCLASAPLWAFYARKIIPDVPATAVSLAGFALLARWLRQGGRAWVPAALLLALAGIMKPLTLCIGLPIVWCLLNSHGWRGALRPPVVATGAVVLGTLLAWVAYAQSITDPQVAWYFTFGIDRQATLQALAGGEPLKRLFIEWPWQMWVSLPLVVGFPLALWRFAARPLAVLALVWLAAAWLVLLPFGVKFGPHDYYTVIAVPPMALLVAIGLARLMAWPRAGACIVVALLAAAPAATWLRIDQRYGRNVDLAPARELSARLLPVG
jgi:4-amino-4-deoxy-L-arabinose transferase-like glycosyltransferase